MAVVNGESLSDASVAFKTEFARVFKNTLVDYPKIATVVNANTISVTYAWLGDMPAMQEWIGDRVIKDLKAHKYSIEKQRFEATVGMDRDYIEYDNLGLFRPQISQLGEVGKMHYDQMVFGLLAKNDICYDGKKFFDNHVLGDNTYTNISDDELSQENFLKARSYMYSIKGEHGKSLKIRPNLLVVPPALESEAIRIAKADMIDGSTNITKGMVEILVSSELQSDTEWYLFDTSRVIKPLILQINRKIKFTAMDNPTDPNVFNKAQFLYGIDGEHNAGYGLWQLAYCSTGVGAS
jgi:phage major head subunit gpT-like protein